MGSSSFSISRGREVAGLVYTVYAADLVTIFAALMGARRAWNLAEALPRKVLEDRACAEMVRKQPWPT